MKQDTMESKTLESKVDQFSFTGRMRQTFGTLKRYTTLALVGTAIAVSPVVSGCDAEENVSECCGEMYDLGECEYVVPYTCKGYGTQCRNYADGTCGCEVFKLEGCEK